jgi:hypothetical protein
VTNQPEQPFDLERIAEALHRHGVAYLTIGGISGMLHGAVDYVTQDVDILVRASIENLERMMVALTDLGADIEGDISASDLQQNTHWRTPAGRIDVLVTALGPNETEITFFDVAPGVE